MSVEFDDNNLAPRNYGPASEPPKIASWLIRKGLAKDLASANRLQVIAAIVFLAISLFLFFK